MEGVESTFVDTIDLGNKAKIMSGFLGIRNTIRHVPKQLTMQLLDPIVKSKNVIGPGVEFYDHNEFRVNNLDPDDPWYVDPPTKYDDFNYEKYGESLLLLNGVDEEGRTISIQITGNVYFIYVECPDGWVQDQMERLANYFRKLYSIPHRDVTAEQVRKHHFCYWEPNGADLTKTRLYNYCILSFSNYYMMKSAAFRLENGIILDGVKRKFKVCEKKIDPVHKALDVMDIDPSGWVEIGKWSIPERYYTHSQIEVVAHWQNIGRSDIDKIAPLWTCGWDIESDSEDRRSFPDPQREGDFVICINSYLRQRGVDGIIQVSHHSGEVAEQKESAKGKIHIVQSDTELETIEKWRDLIVLDIQATVLIGYNVDMFDWKFLADRAKKKVPRYGNVSRLFQSSIVFGEITTDTKKDLNSNAQGENELRWIPMPGRLSIDMYRVIKNDYKLDEYNLNFVCDHFFTIKPSKRKDTHKGRALEYMTRRLKQPCTAKEVEDASADPKSKKTKPAAKIVEELVSQHGYNIETRKDDSNPESECYVLMDEESELCKIDLPYYEIWSNYDAGPESRLKNVIYCAKDAELPSKLADALQILPGQIEMSKITKTPLSQMLVRGQQIKTWNSIVYWCHRYDCVVNLDPNRSNNQETQTAGYEGAIVLEPKCGFYPEPINTLDFASLYPSIMQANNLCFSTLVKNQNVRNMLANKCKEVQLEDGMAVLNKEGQKPLARSFEGDGCSFREVNPTDRKTNIFVQHFKGVVPQILTRLKKQRKDVRALQKNHEYGSLMWLILECRQLSLKITANSIYGFFGAVLKGILPCIDISESVTCIGREMITQTEKFAERDFHIYAKDIPEEVKSCIQQIQVIYGDTDSVMIRHKGITDYKGGFLYWSLQIGKLAAEYITKKFPPDIILEFEKAYYPYILFKKKRYAGLLWTNPDKYDKMDAKGVEVKRRDNWHGLRNTYGECLDAMLNQMDLTLAVDKVLDLLDRVVDDRLELKDYVITKSLKKDYSKSITLPPHVVVRDKIAKRFPGSEPRSGNRVPFVITIDKRTKLVSLRAEDPEYVRQHSNTVKIDRVYYVESLIEPFSKLLEPCFQNPETIFRSAIAKIRAQDNNQTTLCSFFTDRDDRTIGDTQIDRNKIHNRLKRRKNNENYIPKTVQKEMRKKKKNQPQQTSNSISGFMQKTKS
jgi:DNA polymerase elongation subunit (family B)